MTRSRRLEFSSETKRQAFHRAKGLCECHRVPSLPTYRVGCGVALTIANGIYYEHIHQAGIADDASLDNAAVLVRTCWRLKSYTVDIPTVAKSNRVRDRIGRNIRPRHHRPLPGSRASNIKLPFNGPPIDRTTGLPWRTGRRI